ncbi:MAG: cytochrome c [Campylobacteraceae bacterium]|nr:cytochrome c [Campylobacteraceae bacterium]
MKKLFLSLILLSLLISSLLAKNAETLLKENKCMKCHSIMGMKSAPPFSGIARMNSGWFGASKSSIKESIKNGSQGKYPMFSNQKMPAFKKLSDKDIDTIADWIIRQGSNSMRHGMMMHN